MEITYEIEVIPEDTSVRGNYMCTEDAAQDKADEDAVLARLDAGEVEAWCTVKVTASVGEFSHSEYLGCCTLNDTYTKEVCVEEHGMKEEAKASLLAKVNNVFHHAE